MKYLQIDYAAVSVENNKNYDKYCLLVDLETLQSTKITHEQFNETENKKESFRRLVADSFPEGSRIVTKILDIATSTQLKEFHHVKFNQGLLMKLYAYTANDKGFCENLKRHLLIRR